MNIKSFVPLLKELVDINSHSENEEGLVLARNLLDKAFSQLKGKKSLIHKSLLFTKRPQAPIQIFLGGHFDTVYPKDSAFQKFSKHKGGIWRGPGIADMKGGLVVLLAALTKFEKSPLAENIGWRIVLNHDEEIGSLESTPLIKKAANGCHAAFFFEPAFPDGSIVSSRKGSLNLLIKSKGKSAHAGRDLKSGFNAIIPLTDLINRLKKTSGINFGQITGGHAFNVVPDLAELKINFRAEKEIDFQRFFNRFESLILDKDIEWECTSYRPPKPLTKDLKQLIQLLAYPAGVTPSGGVCDGNFTASLGIPTIDTLGVVGGKIHTHDEYIESDSLQERASLFYDFLIRLAKREINLC